MKTHVRGWLVLATSLSLYTPPFLRCTQGRKNIAPKLSVGPQRNQSFFFLFPCLLCFSLDKALSNTPVEQGACFLPTIHKSAPTHPQGPWAGPVLFLPTSRQGQHRATAHPQIKSVLLRWVGGGSHPILLGMPECLEWCHKSSYPQSRKSHVCSGSQLCSAFLCSSRKKHESNIIFWYPGYRPKSQ